MQVQVSGFLITFLLVLLFAILLGHYVKDVWRFLYLPEAGAVLLVGIVIGGFININESAVSEALNDFDPVVFFIAFLPPIVFNAGFHLQQDAFLANIGAILVFAFVGTLTSTLVISAMLYAMQKAGLTYEMEYAEVLTFSSLLSATDPVSTLAVLSSLHVDPNLFYIIFGESVFNDAVALVLFNTLSKFVGYNHSANTIYIGILDFIVVFLSSSLIGVAFALGTAFLYRHLNLSNVVLELSILIMLIYIPFLFATTLGVSGIVSILFMSILSRRYVVPRLSRTAQKCADELSRVLGHLFEAAVFLNLGLSTWSIDNENEYKGGLIFWTLVACLMSRGIHVLAISSAVNHLRTASGSPTRPLQRNEIFLIWFAGLRGAVAYAAASLFPDAEGNRSIVKATTMVIVIITVFVLGGLTETVCTFLKISTNVAPRPSGGEENHNRLSNIEEKRNIGGLLLKFERRFILPYLEAGEDSGLLDNAVPAGLVEMQARGESGESPMHETKDAGSDDNGLDYGH